MKLKDYLLDRLAGLKQERHLIQEKRQYVATGSSLDAEWRIRYKFSHALLMAGWTEVAALAGENDEIFMAGIFTFHTGKAVVQITAIEIPRDHLLDRGPPESVLPWPSAFGSVC